MDDVEVNEFEESGLTEGESIEEILEPEATPNSEPAPEEPAEEKTVKTATAKPKKATKPTKAALKAKKATKPAKVHKPATKKSEKGAPGRISSLTGLKLFKVASEKMDAKVREASRRGQTLAGIKNGMKYETFVEGGGDKGDLAKLIITGHIEAREN